MGRLIPTLVTDHNILVEHIAGHAHRFMYHAGEDKARIPAHNPLPLIDQRRPPIPPDARMVFHHHRIHIGGQTGFERHELFPFAALHYVVRIQPEDKRPGRISKGSVARGGKIVVPRVIINPLREPQSHVFRSIRRACIQNDDFIHGALHAAQAPGESLFLIFDDHAKRKFRHGAPFRRPLRRTPGSSLS